jgi:hypothetical protein
MEIKRIEGLRRDGIDVEELTVKPRRTLRMLLLLLAAGLVMFGVLGYGLIRSKPTWYRQVALSEEDRERAAMALQDRLLALNNTVAESIVAAKTGESERPRAIRIEISEEELNATWQKWEVLPGLRDRVAGLVRDPWIRLLNGQIIVGGFVERLDSVVGLRVSVKETARGFAQLRFDGTQAGLLSVPVTAIERPKQRVRELLSREVVEARARSTKAPLNDAGRKALMGGQLLDLLDGKPVQPILIVKSGLGELTPRPILARLESLEITDGHLVATLRPLTDEESNAIEP